VETAPAPLDALRAAGGGEAALDEFRIAAPRDVQALLKTLVDGAVLLQLHAGDGRSTTSALWTLDPHRGTLGLNADTKDPVVDALVQSDAITVVAYVDSVKLQFAVKGAVLVHGQRASVLMCGLPREIYRFQRRDTFRVKPALRQSPTARFWHPDAPEMELALRIADLSSGGLALFLPDEQPAMAIGAKLVKVSVELDADTRVFVDLELKHVTPLGKEARGVRLGFAFARIVPDDARTLQRFIDLTQKRAKLAGG
jgi:c-di-GMP-binding flagellar brake protein YcgR